MRALGIMACMTVLMESPIALVRVADEISSWNAADEIDDQVEMALDAGAVDVIIDLSNVTYADSLGVAALVRAGSRCRDRGALMRVRDPARGLRDLLRRSADARALRLIAD